MLIWNYYCGLLHLHKCDDYLMLPLVNDKSQTLPAQIHSTSVTEISLQAKFTIAVSVFTWHAPSRYRSAPTPNFVLMIGCEALVPRECQSPAQLSELLCEAVNGDAAWL